MQCPKCESAMAPVTHEGVEIDRCDACGGMWFDATELERVLALEGASRAVDVGEKRVGKAKNAIDRIACPRCRVPMMRLADHEQHHVWYEQCPSCHGTYLDAGELQDLAHYTVLDWFRGLFTRTRR